MATDWSNVPPLIFHPDKESVGRYSRQLILPEFGGPLAQHRLKNSAVLLVGCGGLGCPAALYLAGAGIGCIGLADRDVVEISNLHRQIAHTASGVGEKKTTSLARAVMALNPSVKVELHDDGVSRENAREIVRRYNVVLDCSDNAETRYLVSDACVAEWRPLVSAAAIGLEGQLSVLNFGDNGPCYRCIFPEPPPPECQGSCDTDGVLGMIPGMIGTLQALEALRVLLAQAGIGSLQIPLAGRMLLFDALSYRFRVVQLRARQTETCSTCATFRRPHAGLVAQGDGYFRESTIDETGCNLVLLEGIALVHQEERSSLNSGKESSSMANGAASMTQSKTRTLPMVNAQHLALMKEKERYNDGICRICRIDSMEPHGIGYRLEVSCGAESQNTDSLQRESPQETATNDCPSELSRSTDKVIYIDVRPAQQFALVHIRNAVNVPMNTWPEAVQRRQRDWQGRHLRLVCRRGVQSRKAVELLRAMGWSHTLIEDIPGGMEALIRHIGEHSGNDSVSLAPTSN
ncbi:Urmylation protein [Cyanidiococcus yangmingshanensis]|uniref:Probable molybdopterin-synthase adenylyltransferase n=1 Tax=Cyanidiococcus yangmingshanensis TaxID=2690220 RepID=A0A7J7IKS3_9RHOD|nr:Urmylation protein [Cyanidiococcus yangmingshanensis]